MDVNQYNDLMTRLLSIEEAISYGDIFVSFLCGMLFFIWLFEAVTKR